MNGMELLHQRLQRGHVLFPALNLFVLNDTIKSLAGIEQLLPQRDILFGNKSKFVQMNHCADVRLLDSLGNLDLLLPRQKRDLPHLTQVHPDRII